MDRIIRRVIPSVARLSYNPLFKLLGNLAANLLGFPFQEFRRLPPNHLRARVGVGNKVINNQDYHLQVGREYWLEWFSRGYCDYRSDIVEIGSGCGRIAMHLQGPWFEGSYRGVDIDGEQIDYCRKRFAGDRFSFALSSHESKTYEGTGTPEPQDALDLMGGSDSKDFIFSTSLFTHLLEAEIEEYLEACFGALRPAGKIYMTFFCLEFVHLGGRWTFENQIGNAYVESLKFPEAAVAYHDVFLIGLATRLGFEEVLVIPKGGQSVLSATKPATVSPSERTR